MLRACSRSSNIVLSLLLFLLASCSETETAIEVEFVITGEGSEEAAELEVYITCEDDESIFEHPEPYDLDRLGDTTPSLALEPGNDDPCTILLGAQVFSHDSALLAVAGTRLSFIDGEIQHITLTLDTASCDDVDNDGSFAGRGGDLGCGELTDCDDLDPSVSPTATELCNGIDDDCNGVVDDLDPDALVLGCAEQSINWNPGVGLCRFVSPECIGGQLFCPQLSDLDSCDPPLDTNCDGRLGPECGCSPELVASYRCPDCHTAQCEGDELVCLPNQRLGQPCEIDGCPGVLECNPETNEEVCIPMTEPFEICGNGIDDDCDSLIDDELSACQTLPAEGLLCPTMTLYDFLDFSLADDPCEEGRAAEAYDLDHCAGGLFGFGGNDNPELIVAFDVPANLAVTSVFIEGCCGCDARFFNDVEGSETGSRFGILVIEGYLRRLYLQSSDPLTAYVDINILNDEGAIIARYERLPLSLPIASTILPRNVECTSFCTGSGSANPDGT